MVPHIRPRGTNHLEARDIGVPAAEVLGVLGGHTSCWTIGTSEDYGDWDLGGGSRTTGLTSCNQCKR